MGLYNGMLGLAGISARYERLCQQHLQTLVETAASASEWQARATKDEGLAVQHHETAAAEESEIAAESAREEELRAAVARDEAQAGAAETAETEREREAAAEQVDSAQHAQAAAEAAETEAATREESLAEATAAGETLVADDQVLTAMSVCQFVPGLDVVCDVVGGATAVVWEGVATDELAQSAAAWAAASAAALQEERETAVAAEHQEVAVAEAGEAAALREEMGAAQVRAQEEAAEATELQAVVEEQQEEAEEAEALAEEETAQAAAAQDEAAALWRQSARAGVEACGAGLVAAVTGTVALLFFGLQMLLSWVLPGALWLGSMASSGVMMMVAPGSTAAASASCSSALRPLLILLVLGASHVAHHVLSFALSAEIVEETSGTLLFANHFTHDFGVRERGAVILRLAGVAALLQTVLRHALPGPYAAAPTVRWRHSSGGSLAVATLDAFLCNLTHFVLLTMLFVLEFLTLWVVLGPHRFENLLSNIKSPGMIWLVVMAVCTTSVRWMLPLEEDVVTSSGQEEDADAKTNDPLLVVECINEEDEPTHLEPIITETSSLLGGVKGSPYSSSSTNSVKAKPDGRQPQISVCSVLSLHARSFWKHFGYLRYPLEIFVCSCTVALLLHCVPTVWKLWPASKALLWPHAPLHWRVPVSFWTAAAMGSLLLAIVIGSVVLAVKRCRRHSVKTIDD